jgi:hypothetical protein
MAQSALAQPKINTNPTQATPALRSRRPANQKTAARPKRGPARVAGEERSSSRDSDRLVIDVGDGVVVYPPEGSGGVWRAVFTARVPVKASSEVRARAARPGRLARPGAAGRGPAVRLVAQPCQLGLQLPGFLLHEQDPADAGQVEAVGGQRAYLG